jgi:hypothetical protein
VRKPLQKEAVGVGLGFSLVVVCELELGLGSAIQGLGDRGFSAQTVLAMASGSLGYYGESDISLAGLDGDIGASLCVSARAELPVSQFQERLGGGFTMEVLH